MDAKVSNEDVLWPAVQSWISDNPGLKLKTLFQFVYFCTSVYFKTSEKKTPFDSDKIPEEIFINKRLGNLL